MPTRRLILAAGALTLGAAGAALAHHGWGEYDANTVLRITSPIDEVSPGNPHVTIKLKNAGKTWTSVLAPPSRMTTRGLPPESLVRGTSVTVEGYPAKDGKPEMRAERITVAGKTVELR